MDIDLSYVNNYNGKCFKNESDINMIRVVKLIDLKKQIEDTRDKLNTLIATKEIITDDKELLEISVRLDKLINIYIHTKNNELAL